MGEVIFSIFVGGWLIAGGVFLNGWLTREERRTREVDTAERGDKS